MSRLLMLTVLVLITAISTQRSFADDSHLHQLPSGPKGPGAFGAYYTKLDYNPDWDEGWRVGEHSDVVVRFDDGGHKFVFWRGTSYIPCWVTDNDIWYTNEFVERRGWHSPNTEGCVEPMSDKQCRYSHVRIIENNDARVVVHWRYAPVDIHYEHPFISDSTGWYDWVDEYYVIYPDSTGVRQITAHSTNLGKWMEFHEGIVINQPGTYPHDNIELGAVSVANMDGEHVTYFWGEDGAPRFDKNPSRSNIYKVNLKSSRSPFALVEPPKIDGNIITSYMGRSETSPFHWWDHWPVSQDASDGRSAVSAKRPSHTSLCHIDIPKLTAVNCFGPNADDTQINNGVLEWVTKEAPEICLAFHNRRTNSDSFHIGFDYADLWTSELSVVLTDWLDNTITIELDEFASELALNANQFHRFEKTINLTEYESYDSFGEFKEVSLWLPDSSQQRVVRLDNLVIRNNAPEPSRLVREIDFDLPDGSLVGDIVLEQYAAWDAISKSENRVTKLMLHGLTTQEVQELTPLARSWTNPPDLSVTSSTDFHVDYDKSQLAYVIQAENVAGDTPLSFLLAGSNNTPIRNPAFVIKGWQADEVELLINGKAAKAGEHYRLGRERNLESDYLVLWTQLESTDQVAFELRK